MKSEEAKPDKEIPEYRVDDPQEAWARFEALAKKAMTTPKLANTNVQSSSTNEENPRQPVNR